MIGRVCEEFPGALPTDVMRELETDPDRTVLTIMRMRAFDRARTAFKQAVDAGRAVDLPNTPMMSLVKEFWAERAERSSR